MARTASPSVANTGERVSSLELFFDLVFVFTITQLTSLLARDPTLTGLIQTALIFGNVWWMYGGYAWLTNAVPPRELGVRLLLLLGMGAFLVVALSIPTTFAAGGVAFGVGYLIVNIIHTGLFLRTSQQSVLQSMRRLGPSNILTAGLLLIAGFTPPSTRLVLFGAGIVLHWLTPFFTHTGGFRIQAAHFVERHGLILLIAIGESVVAVGIGLGTAELPLGRIVAALLGLALAAGLWWLYFNGDEQRAETAIRQASPERQPWLALNGFGYAFLLVLGGIVVIAAGMKLAVVRYDQPATIAIAAFLAGGIATYAIGLALFRWLLRTGQFAVCIALAIVAVPTALIGVAFTPIWQLLALVAILIAADILDNALSSRAALR